MRTLNVFLAAVIVTVCASAQNPELVFDAASIKPSAGLSDKELEVAKVTARSSSIVTSPGGLMMRDITLRECIGWAYRVNFWYQIAGAPSWSTSDRYDIQARTAQPASEDQLRAMLQNLLADRFKVALHRETKEMSAHMLTVGKAGWKLEPVDRKDDALVRITRARSGGLGLGGQQASISDLANFMSRIAQTPVVDTTGIMGRYDFTIELAPQQDDNKYSLTPDLVLAGVERIGLKVESRKMPVEILVIDHAEKPAAN